MPKVRDKTRQQKQRVIDKGLGNRTSKWILTCIESDTRSSLQNPPGNQANDYDYYWCTVPFRQTEG